MVDDKDKKLVQELTTKLSSLKQTRSPWESQWQEIADLVLPRRADFKKDNTKGANLASKMYDGTAHNAAQLLADGLQGYMTSPNSKWFKLIFGDTRKELDDEGKEWLEEIENRISTMLDASNFYDVISQVFLDGVTLGTSVMYVELDQEEQDLYFSCRHLKEIYIAVDKHGHVDTLFRVYKQAKRNIAKKFKKGLDEEYIKAAEKTPFEEDTIIHAVFPRDDRKAYKIDKLNKPWASVYMLEDEQKVLHQDGYDEFPYLTWRYRTNPDEVYGRSPAWSGLPDIKVANQIQKTLLEAAHKAVDPPWWVTPAVKDAGGLNLTPRGMNYFAGMAEPPSPLVSGQAYPIGRDTQEAVQLAVKEHFRVDFFLMLSQMAGQKITATQVMEMQGEKAAIMSTMVSRLQSEFLDPLFDRVFGLVYRAGWLPPPPQSVIEQSGGDIKVDYVGPLAQAVKRHFNTQNFKQSIFEFMGMLEAMPGMALLIDEMKLGRELLRLGGVPEDIVRDEEEVKKMQADMAQQEAQQMQMMQQAQGADTFGKLTKAPEPGSPAEAMSA